MFSDMGVADVFLPVENLSDTTISMEIESGTGLRASEDQADRQRRAKI